MPTSMSCTSKVVWSKFAITGNTQVFWRRQILSRDGLAAAESRFALVDEGANRFLVVDCSGCPNQILGLLIH